MSKPKVTQVTMTVTMTVEDSTGLPLSRAQAWGIRARWLDLLRHIQGWEFTSLQWRGDDTVEVRFSP